MEFKNQILILLFFTFICFQCITARNYCVQTANLQVWCDDSYNCCDNSRTYWCCKKFTHSCASDYMDCKVSAGLILIIVAIILVIVGVIVGIILFRRKKNRGMVIQQQTQQQPQYQQQMDLAPKLNQQQYY